MIEMREFRAVDAGRLIKVVAGIENQQLASKAVRVITSGFISAPFEATLGVLLRHRERPDQYISGFETLKDAVHKDGGF